MKRTYSAEERDLVLCIRLSQAVHTRESRVGRMLFEDLEPLAVAARCRS